MDNWKDKFGSAFQKVNLAGRNLLSTLGYSELEQNAPNEYNFDRDALNALRSRYQAVQAERQQCLECDKKFRILTINDDEETCESDVERQKDREEIRRKLAMDSDNEDYVVEKMNQSEENASSSERLKSGSNLQICFLNEAAKESEVLETSQNIEPVQEKLQKMPRILKRNLLFPPSLPKCISNSSKVQNNNNENNNSSSSPPPPRVVKRQRPTFFFNRPRSWHAAKVEEKPDQEEDLFARHRRLQAEAREALSQAKDMARMQMEIERQKKKKSPIADIVGISFPDGSNLLSRHALVDMNVAQLQVIVNDLHSQIETLNEDLVKFLLERDDLHMEQDSMLVDIEDLTRYLGLKGNCSITHSDSKIATDFQGSGPENR